MLKSLLHVHSILQSGDNTYILNDLYVTDYCIWIQHVRYKHCMFGGFSPECENKSGEQSFRLQISAKEGPSAISFLLLLGFYFLECEKLRVLKQSEGK